MIDVEPMLVAAEMLKGMGFDNEAKAVAEGAARLAAQQDECERLLAALKYAIENTDEELSAAIFARADDRTSFLAKIVQAARDQEQS